MRFCNFRLRRYFNTICIKNSMNTAFPDLSLFQFKKITSWAFTLFEPFSPTSNFNSLRILEYIKILEHSQCHQSKAGMSRRRQQDVGGDE